MATQFYVDQADRSYLSGVADEDIKAGVLIFDDGTGVRRLEFADGDYDGLAVHDPEVLAAEDHDVGTTAADFTYASGDRVRYQPSEDGAILRVRTIKDNSTDPAASVSHRDVVGIVDETVATLSGSAQDFEGRIVEEGYTDGDATPTTYNRSNSNFLALGRALRPALGAHEGGNAVSEFDYPLKVAVFDELKA